jgi:endonuclease YncB( thermonuclease family)
VNHTVKYVFDGDTVLLKSGKKVRYLGIDAPEIDHEEGKHEFMALSAKDFNSNLVKGAKVRLEYDQEKKDRYGRLLAYLFLENGKMINALLLERGLAYVLLKTPNLKYKEQLLKCQRKAINEKIGIWSKNLKLKEKEYIGNKRSFRFHRPDCPFGKKTSPRNRFRFKSRIDAFWEGYGPCKRCKP